ncbi:MAG: phosphoenolpyruvate carboxykinase (GTP) [Chlamydiales bacterium]|nr:phosphoenolpyruvate carboxykinase (GTP) [Chlamydiales bacterium]
MDILNDIQSQQLKKWVREIVALCEPGWVHLCDGSQAEFQSFADALVEKGVFVALNQDKRPNSYWCASDPKDVSRVEDRTFICAPDKEDVGPTNHWEDPILMKKKLRSIFNGCMRGRKMYIIPFSMGPFGSPFSILGVQITDSPYVVCNMHMMTRMGKEAFELIEKGSSFVPCIHSVGVPLDREEEDVPWPCREDKDKYIVHFPQTKEIWSFGSGYGGNALLGKKCLALRIASEIGKEQGWLAEHMLIIKITNPTGQHKYLVAAFPSSCGKTNLAMLTSVLPGWKIECVGDDIAWMRFKEDGRLYAINPEYGFFGVAPGTSWKTNPNAMKTIEKNTIFTNTALTQDGDVWWEGMSEQPPLIAMNWKKESWTKESKEKAAHPNSRFTVCAKQCPILDTAFDSPEGVPIDGIIFGGRRASVMPLICEAKDWEHGVFMGASLSSEMTAAAVGEIGKLRHDPFAMLPFCGYHMGDYFQHWINMKDHPNCKLPTIFHVNWFLKNKEGNYLWPGYGENTRVLKWIFDRIDNKVKAQETPIGFIPYVKDIDISNLKINQTTLEQLLFIDKAAWRQELSNLKEYFKQFYPRLPAVFEHIIEKCRKEFSS